ncbi:unnamed protein product, partial [Brassica oleracea]
GKVPVIKEDALFSMQETLFLVTTTTPPFPESLCYLLIFATGQKDRDKIAQKMILAIFAQRFHFQTEFLLSQLRSSTPCVSDCKIMEINVTCGWFSSVRLVNPRVFRRLSYYDCLVKDGQPLAPGQTLSFLYANSFSYPLSVSSVSCF